MLKLSAYSKEPGESGGSAAWRGRNVNTNGTNGTCVGTCVEALWGEFNAGFLQGIPAFPVSLSLEGVSQMVYILPERLLALVRPAFDLVLRRIV